MSDRDAGSVDMVGDTGDRTARAGRGRVRRPRVRPTVTNFAISGGRRPRRSGSRTTRCSRRCSSTVDDERDPVVVVVPVSCMVSMKLVAAAVGGEEGVDVRPGRRRTDHRATSSAGSARSGSAGSCGRCSTRPSSCSTRSTSAAVAAGSTSDSTPPTSPALLDATVAPITPEASCRTRSAGGVAHQRFDPGDAGACRRMRRGDPLAPTDRPGRWPAGEHTAAARSPAPRPNPMRTARLSASNSDWWPTRLPSAAPARIPAVKTHDDAPG